MLATDLQLPPCAIPRPGEVVCWFSNGGPLKGTLRGHKAGARPQIDNQFGGPTTLDSFLSIRLADHASRMPPNWQSLPQEARIVRPIDTERSEFQRILDQRTPPGPKYIELFQEIHARGHEVFLVGGTVRDVLAGIETNDVDMATTMPLAHAMPLLSTMYRIGNKPERAAERNGHLRLGGRLGASDPFIDFCVFRHSFVGDNQALFSTEFERDTKYRDFACNAVYYDPVNDVLIDPCGRGIHEAEEKQLSLVCDPHHGPFYRGKIALRFFKFLSRELTATDSCKEKIADFIDCICVIPSETRASYVQTQVLSKAPLCQHKELLQEYSKQFVSFGAGEVWAELLAPHCEEMLK